MSKGTEEVAKLSVSLSLESQSFTKQMTTINKQIKQADKDFKSAGKGVNGFENTFVGLSAKMQKTVKQIDLYNTKLVKQKEEHKKLTSDLEATKNKLDEIEQTQGKGSKAWKDQAKLVQTNAEKLTTLDGNINTTKSNISKLTNELKDTQQGFTELSNKTKTADEKLEDIKRQAELNQSEFSKLGTELNGTGDYFKRLGNDMNVLADKISTGTKKIEVYEKEIEQLSIKLKSSKKEHNSLIKEIDKVEKELSESEKAFGKNAKETETLKKKLYTLKDTYNKLDSEIDKGEKSLNSYQKELNETQTEVNELGRELRNLPFETIGQDLANVGSTITSAGQTMTRNFTMPFTALAGASMKVGVQFDRTMSKVGAISGATGDDLESLRKKALELGSSTKFSASQISEAMTFMGMAGYDTGQILDSVNGVVNLSIAGNVDLATASDIVTDGLSSMGLSAKDCNDYVDIMAATITSSNTSVELMGETMKYAGAVAGGLGIEMEDLSVAIGLMANAGIKGSSSGTALRSGLTRLISPTQKAYNTMQDFGIEIQKNEDGTVNLAETISHLRDKLGGLDATTQASVVSTVFGKEAMSGWMSVINATDEDVKKLTASVKGSTKVATFWKESIEGAGYSTEETTEMVDNLNEVFSDNKMVADALNISTTDLAKMITLLGNDGKVASKDVEQLMGGILNLQRASGKSKDAMKELGIEVAKFGDGSIDPVGTLLNIKNALTGMTEEEQKSAIANMGLKDSQDELLEILNLSPEAFNTIVQKMDETKGASEVLAEVMGENLGAEIDSMKSSIETSLISTFKTLEPVMRSVIEKITDMADWYNELDEEERKQILTIAGVVACIGPLLVILGNLISFGANVTIMLGGMTTAGGGLAGILGTLGTVALPLIIAILVAVATVLGDNEQALYTLQEKWGGLGTVIGGVCEFISGVVQLTFGNAINLIMLIVDLIAAMIDGPGGATIEDAWNNFNNKVAKTTEEGMQKVALATTRGMSQLRNATDEQLNGMLETANTTLAELPNIVDGKYKETAEKLGSQLAVMDATQLTALQGMNETTKILFKGISEEMTIDNVVARLESNFKTAHESGRLEMEGLNTDINEVIKLITENMDTGTEQAGQKVTENISTTKNNVVKDTKTIATETGKNLDTTKQVADTKTKETSKLIQSNVKSGVANADKELNTLSKNTEKNFNQANKTVRQSATDMYNGVKTSFAKMEQICKQHATDMYKGVSTSAKKMCDNAKRSATDMYLGVTTSTNKMKNKAIADWNAIRNAYSKGIKGKITTTHTKINVSKDEETFRSLRAIANADSILNISRVATTGSYYNNDSVQSVGFSRAINTSKAGVLNELLKLNEKNNTQDKTADKKIYVEIPLSIDGREIARVSAIYMDDELKIINNRNARNRGEY